MSTATAEFRTSLRAFLTGTAEQVGRPPRDPAGRLEWQRAWARALVDGGWSAPSWPADCGGLDLDFARQVVYQEEIARARVPGVPGTGVPIAAPTIIKYGTAEQKARFLPSMIRGDVIWAQGYSEPEAGSDLPALRTSAIRQADEYVVNGHKIWTTAGDIADVLFVLVRTGKQGSRQGGITYLVIDVDQPGVTVRPIRDITGGTKFSEVFFSDARVPVADRIGEENDGWRLARTSLGFERAASSMNQAAMYRRVLDELVDLANSLQSPLAPWVKERLTGFEIDVRLMRCQATRAINSIMTRGEPGPGASVSRLFNTGFEQDLHEFALELIGPAGLISGEDLAAVERGRWLRGFLGTRASTIGAGTAEIQRNTIAEQVLGLPRDVPER